MSVTDAKDAESIVERVIPRLQHANSAVVLSAVKVSCPHPQLAGARVPLHCNLFSTPQQTCRDG